MKALLRKGKKEVDRREEREGKGRGRDLPDQCQSASYAPVSARLCIGDLEVYDCTLIHKTSTWNIRDKLLDRPYLLLKELANKKYR